MWGSVKVDELHEDWRDELRHYDGQDLADALDAMRTGYLDYPPTLFQFAALCRDARRRRGLVLAALPSPSNVVPMPERIRKQLADFRLGGRSIRLPIVNGGE